MAYVKWVANADRHNDWTSELLLNDGTEVRMGEPADLKADMVKELESQGRVFEKSSKEDFDEFNARPEVIQPPGNDVRGTGPIFVNSGQQFNQASVVEDEEGTDQSPKATAPAKSTTK